MASAQDVIVVPHATGQDVKNSSSRKRRFSASAVENATYVKPKTKKRKKSKAKDDARDIDIDTEHFINRSIGKMDTQLLADYFAQRTRHFAPNLSLVELQDRQVPEHAFCDTSTWDQSRNLASLPSYLKTFAGVPQAEKVLSSSSNTPGMPHTLVITSAGLRAADISRSLKTFQSQDSKIAKLFAKHIKLKEAVEHLKNTRIGIGVGTPSRLSDLIEIGALSIRDLKRIVIDASHINQKKQNIMDMRESQEALVSLLTRPDTKAKYGDNKNSLKILCF